MTDRHEHLDEGTIHAWLDEALPPDESARVESLANSCTECAALVAEARGLMAASSRILASLDDVPAGVIPGSAGGVDQLAALRARNRTRKRHWWNDRRLVAAASLVFVAGVSTMVWRFAPESARSPVTATVDVARPAVDTQSRVASAPAATAPASESAVGGAASARDAASEAKMSEARAPAAPPAPTAVVGRAADTVAQEKVAASLSLPRMAANEAVRGADSAADRTRQAEPRRLSRADQVAPIQQQAARQEGTTGQRQGFQQLRPDTMRVNTPPPSFGAGARMARVTTTAASDASVPPSRCFALRPFPATPAIGVAVPDTVQLLNEFAPILSDPTSYRARTFGAAADTTWTWSQPDSNTVVLSRGGTPGTALLFTLTGAQPDVRRLAGVTPVLAGRVVCPVR